MAKMTWGARKRATSPETARAKNQTTITGPKAHATFSVPRAWKVNRKIAITAAISIRRIWAVLSKPGIKRIPSTAERILIAGVITPSPIKSEMPMMVRRETNATWFPDFKRGSRISFNTMVPPSPFLPRCMARNVYCTVTRMVSVQNIRERIPITFWGVGGIKRKMAVNV